jgi:hypothetical protein
MEGRALILQSGGKELFSQLHNSLPPSEIQIVALIEKLMQSLILNETYISNTQQQQFTEPNI